MSRFQRSPECARIGALGASIGEKKAMLPFWIFLAFMLGLIAGSLIARGLGALPDAVELEQQDQARFAKIERSQ